MTLIRRVQGAIDGQFFRPENVLVHFTSDKMPDGRRNETISFAVKGHQLTMKWKPIHAIIEKERGLGYTTFHNIIDESEAYIPVDWLEDWARKHGETMEMIDDWKQECRRIYHDIA